MYITRGIVESMQCTHGSRFLRQVNTPTTTTGGNNNSGVGWMELTDQQARDKTSHALRFYLKNKQRDTDGQQQPAQEQRSNTRRRRNSSIEQPYHLDVSTTSSTQSSIPATVTSSSTSSSMDTPVQIAIPIDDPIFARQQAILQQTMFVTAAPSMVDPMVVVSSASSSASANIPMAIAMDVDMSDRFDAMTRSEDFSIFNGNTLRSEDLNALFNSSLSSVEAMMVVSGTTTTASATAHIKSSTDTMRSEDLNYIFNLEDDEWDEVMKD
jgi:hypothetical protein